MTEPHPATGRLYSLAIGTFAVGVDGFITAGLVEPISADLHVSVAAAGQLVTVFAVAYALLSPVLATLTARLSRRTVLLTALALLILGNIGTALAGDFTLALVTRVVAAAGASMYTPNATAVAAGLVPPERRGRAIGVVIGGLTVSLAIGVPLGTWVGGALSWRGALWLVAGIAAVALIVVAALVPAMRIPMPTRLADRLAPLRRGRTVAILLCSVLVFTSVFVAYTYLAPVFAEATGGSPTRFPMLMLAYGLASTVASVLGGRLVDSVGPRRLQRVLGPVLVLVLAVLPLAAVSYPTALLWAVAFAFPGWIWTSSQQARLVGLDPTAAPLLLGLNASAQYVGIALGGGIGGLTLGHFGVAAIGLVAAVVAVMGAGVGALTWARSRVSVAA